MKLGKLKHFFIPHPETHQKTPLLSWHFLIIYLLIFILLKVGIDLISLYRPGILGINSQVNTQSIIEATNQERQKKGLPILVENQALSYAAQLKASNMFEENYWAHYSPSGQDPWKFILGADYKFSYAGENLARNFYNSPDVVSAWMSSFSHRDNILNSNYQDIGVAVVDGILNGQKTTLVVQMFGKPYETAVKPQVSLGGKKILLQSLDLASSQPILAAQSQKPVPLAKVDSFTVTKTAGLSIISVIAFLITLDLLILKKRRVFRLSSQHLAHLSFLAVAAASLVLTKAGEIL